MPHRLTQPSIRIDTRPVTTTLPVAGDAAARAGRGDLRGVVRLPGRADPGPAAARGRHLRRRARPSASWPSCSGSASPPARTTSASSPTSDSCCCARSGTTHRRVGQPGLLHRPAARRRRRHGRAAARPCCPDDLPDRRHRPGPGADATGPTSAGSTPRASPPATPPSRPRCPTRRALDAKWLPGHRWVAEIDGQVVGWTAITPVSARDCYAGVAETSVYVGADGPRPRGRQGPAAPAGHRRRRRRPLDPADLDLPGEPGQPRPAPLRRLPHPRRARAHRPAPRRLAGHRPARTPQPGRLTPRQSADVGGNCWQRRLDRLKAGGAKDLSSTAFGGLSSGRPSLPHCLSPARACGQNFRPSRPAVGRGWSVPNS